MDQSDLDRLENLSTKNSNDYSKLNLEDFIFVSFTNTLQTINSQSNPNNTTHRWNVQDARYSIY